MPFPESEGRPQTYYANPFPLSEEHYLVAWSDRPLQFQGETNDTAALGVYLYDAFGNLNLLYRDRSDGQPVSAAGAAPPAAADRRPAGRAATRRRLGCCC